MGQLLRIVGFGSPLMVVDDVTFLLLAVEVWSDAVHVRAAAEASPLTEALTAAETEQYLAWRRSGRVGQPPSGGLSDVQGLIHVSDSAAALRPPVDVALSGG